MRPFLAILTLLLVVLAVVAAFVAGYTVRGSSGSAGLSAASSLNAVIVSELQAHYYKPIDAARLEQAGVKATLAALHDPYTVYLTPKQSQALTQSLSGTYSGIGAEFVKRGSDLVVTRVFRGSPAKAGGIAAGDHIVTVDGVAVSGESDTVAAAHIKGAEGTQVTLGVRTAGKGPVRRVTLTRRVIVAPETATRLLHSGGKAIGYIYVPSFSVGVGNEVRRDVVSLQARGAQAFVLDLRYDLGGYITDATSVASDFLSGGVVVSTHGLHDPTRIYRASGHPATSLPLVVLVNHWSASASEITAGALQDHGRATVIGQRTYGKGVAQTNFTLPDGGTLHMTIAGYLTPSGRDINHKGITPSVKVVDNPKTPRDEALDRAVRYLVAGS
ncbi:MAG TPA: S41 family peptidase [Thermoleophilia bacterium]|nr:S41 family peptidase [Thermoleophilia bacterium]